MSYKNILIGLILCLCIYTNNYSQPYIYSVKSKLDSTSQNNLYDVLRISLQTGFVNTFFNDAEDIANCYWDRTQTWLLVEHLKNLSLVYNLTDTAKHFYIPDNIGGIGCLLYSSSRNKLYIISSSIDQNLELISILNLNSFRDEIDFPLTYSDEAFNLDNNSGFFSENEDLIYLASTDSIKQTDQIISFSTITNQIVRENYISELGYPSSDGYILRDGCKGKALIESYTRNPTLESYFNVYDLEQNSKLPFIHYGGNSNAYLSRDCKNIIIAQVVDSSKGDIIIKSYNTGQVSIYDAISGILKKELSLPAKGLIYTFDNYPNMFYYFLPSTQQATPIDLTTLALPTGLNAKLVNSNGVNLTTGSLQYYDGAWKDAVNNNDGTFFVNTTLKNVSLRMTYEYGTQTLSNVPVGSDTVFFRTVNTQVKLQNSSGAPIDTGTVQYYAGAWRNFGTTSNGIASMELLPNNYSFRMTYAYASNDKQQDIDTNSSVVFQTLNTAVQLKNSSGSLIDTGTVQYYAGAWRNFGTTSNGIASLELLPNNYSFRMTYAYASNDKQQDIGTNSTVVFQMVNTAVQLKNSSGTPIDMGTVQYYSGAWRNFGTTSNGVASMELLPNNYSFRMTYAYASNDKQQNTSANPVVVFQTVNTAVQLKNSSGSLIDTGTVQYYSGAWRNFGTTSNGVVNMELLPNTYSFRMTYAFVSKDLAQNIGTSNIVTFSTVLCTINVTNSQGQPVNNADAKYYSGAWREIGLTTNGVITKELLPANLTFQVINGKTQLSKTQDLSTNNIVNFTLH